MAVGLVSSLPSVGQAHSGVAYYAESLGDALAHSGLDVIAFANNDARSAAGAVRVQAVWKPGALYPAEILRAVRRANVTTILLEHTPFLYGGGAAGIAAFPLLLTLLRLANRRIVTDLHDVRPLATIDRSFVQSLGLPIPPTALRFAYKTLFGSIARLSHHVIVHDAGALRTLVADYGAAKERVSTIPLLPPSVSIPDRTQARDALAIPQSARCLLFFGYASAYKGLDVLAEALESLRDEGGLDDLVVVIGAGPNPHLVDNEEYRKYYETIRERLSSNRFVAWRGFINDEDVATYFAAADAVILPYTASIGSSYPLAQAVAYGRRILASARIPVEGYDADITVFEPAAPNVAQAISAFARHSAAPDSAGGEKSTAAIAQRYCSVLSATES